MVGEPEKYNSEVDAETMAEVRRYVKHLPVELAELTIKHIEEELRNEEGRKDTLPQGV